MKRKLLNIAHNRSDNFISRKYKGLLAENVDKSSISVASGTKKVYSHNDQPLSTPWTWKLAFVAVKGVGMDHRALTKFL